MWVKTSASHKQKLRARKHHGGGGKDSAFTHSGSLTEGSLVCRQDKGREKREAVAVGKTWEDRQGPLWSWASNVAKVRRGSSGGREKKTDDEGGGEAKKKTSGNGEHRNDHDR